LGFLRILKGRKKRGCPIRNIEVTNSKIGFVLNPGLSPQAMEGRRKVTKKYRKIRGGVFAEQHVLAGISRLGETRGGRGWQSTVVKPQPKMKMGNSGRVTGSSKVGGRQERYRFPGKKPEIQMCAGGRGGGTLIENQGGGGGGGGGVRRGGGWREGLVGGGGFFEEESRAY